MSSEFLSFDDFGYPFRCDVVDTVVEMDRIVRPGGYVLIQESLEVIKELGPMFRSLHWSVSVYEDEFLVGKKGFWRPSAPHSK